MNLNIPQLLQPKLIFLNQGSIDFDTGQQLCSYQRFNYPYQSDEIRLIEASLEEGDLVQLQEGIFILDLDLMAQPYGLNNQLNQ